MDIIYNILLDAPYCSNRRMLVHKPGYSSKLSSRLNSYKPYNPQVLATYNSESSDNKTSSSMLEKLIHNSINSNLRIHNGTKEYYQYNKDLADLITDQMREKKFNFNEISKLCNSIIEKNITKITDIKNFVYSNSCACNMKILINRGTNEELCKYEDPRLVIGDYLVGCLFEGSYSNKKDIPFLIKQEFSDKEVIIK